jgi:hypothetical protein
MPNVSMKSKPPFGERWVRWWGRLATPFAAWFNLLLAIYIAWREPAPPIGFRNMFLVPLFLALLLFERRQFHKIIERQDKELAQRERDGPSRGT